MPPFGVEKDLVLLFNARSGGEIGPQVFEGGRYSIRYHDTLAQRDREDLKGSHLSCSSMNTGSSRGGDSGRKKGWNRLLDWRECGEG